MFVWNCRGACFWDFVSAAKQYMDNYKPNMCAFLETRSSSINAGTKLRKLGSDKWICSENDGYAGGIWVAWKSNMLGVSSVEIDFQYIHIKINCEGRSDWLATFAYTSPCEDLKNIFWNNMIRIAREVRGPWLVIGDLNDILNANKKKGAPINMGRCEKFSDRLNQCGLIDIHAQGH